MRKSISVAFFSLVSTLMVLGIVLMGASEWVLFKNYFAKDRYETLDQVVGVTQRTAQYLVQQAELPEGDELDALSTKLEIIGESAEAYLFFTDNDGRVMIASSPDKLESLTVPEEMMEKIDASDADYYHVFGTLGGMLDGKSYITVSEMRNENGQPSGYLFLCSSGEQLTQFKQQFWSNFLLSACVMLLCASILTKILMRQLTDPLQKVTDAAQRFGGGDLSVRVEGVEGEGEAADLARTFNRMADNIQMNDNSRGQFMGNIAHELRTPMTTIKGFVDGILDGTIPPDMQNHYLQLVSEETGRLARLIQNMLDLSKLESGEYQVNARMFNIWETITGVALSAEQRINDGMIDIDGLTMDEKVLVYADPDLIHQVVYNLLDNAIKFTPAGGTIRFGVEKLGPEAEISIWNSGQGISPEALPYVFQRFYKEDRSRGLHARGAGLGLNICKVLVNLSGGQIRVESQQGEWCRFVFTLPTVAPNPGGITCDYKCTTIADKNVYRLDLETGKICNIPVEENAVVIRLGSFESQWIQISNNGTDNKISHNSIRPEITIPLDAEWKMKPLGKNFCRFGYVDMSLNRIEWENVEVKTFIEQCDSTKLLEKQQLRFSGAFGTPKKITPAYPLACWYRVEFQMNEVPEDICIFMDRETMAGSYQLFINGKKADQKDWYDVFVNDKNNQALNIYSMVKEGKNSIEIQMNIEKDEDGLRDPLYLWGSFGVTETAGIPLLTKQPETGCPDRHWCKGFPYYSGTMEYETCMKLEIPVTEQQVNCFDIKLGFQVPTYDCIETRINGVSLGVKAYTPYVWQCPRDVLQKDENIITIAVTNTLANMLDGTYFDYDSQKLVNIEP